MRILYLTSRLPYPPNRGDRLRAFHFIKNLSGAHDLSLVSFIAEESERKHLASLKPFCRDIKVVMMSRWRSIMNVSFSLWHSDPLQALYYRSRAMRQVVDQTLAEKQFDAVYVHLFRMAPYVVDHTYLYRIVDLTDVISKEIGRSLPYRGLAARLIYQIERPRIARYEQWVAKTFEETWLVSEADRNVLAATHPAANIQVVPNGVDAGRFRPTKHICQPNSLIFVGHLRVFHNIDAVTHLVQDVLPLVQTKIPGCTLEIVGADPDPRVLRLGRSPGVTVTGFIPDLNAYLNRAAVFTAPLRFAAGVQNKVLEAMAAAKPVVTTGLVNEGLGAQPGWEILVGDDAHSMANHIVALLQDEHLRIQIGQAARQFVRRKFRWNYVTERIADIEKDLAAK